MARSPLTWLLLNFFLVRCVPGFSAVTTDRSMEEAKVRSWQNKKSEELDQWATAGKARKNVANLRSKKSSYDIVEDVFAGVHYETKSQSNLRKEKTKQTQNRHRLEVKYHGSTKLSERLAAMRKLETLSHEQMRENYDAAEAGANCHEGYVRITSPRVCKQAWYFLGAHSDFRTKLNKSDLPGGCMKKDSKVLFNKGNGSLVEAVQLLCEKAEVAEHRQEVQLEYDRQEAARKEAERKKKDDYDRYMAWMRAKQAEEQRRAWQEKHNAEEKARMETERARRQAEEDRKEQKNWDDHLFRILKEDLKEKTELAKREYSEKKTAEEMKAELKDEVQEIYMRPPSVDIEKRDDAASNLGILIPNTIIGERDTPKEELGFGEGHLLGGEEGLHLLGDFPE